MRRARHTRSLVEALGSAAAGDLEISVKCRIGVHDALAPNGAVPDDSYDVLRSFVDEAVVGGGASHVVVHARSAVLGGLSPGKNRVVPPLRHAYVRRLAADLPGLRVTLNGGLALGGNWLHGDSCRDWLGPEVDGVMLGRSVLRHPLDLWQVDNAWPGLPHRAGSARSAARARTPSAAIDQYVQYACRMLASRDGGRRSARAADVLAPLVLVAEHLREADSEADGGEEEISHPQRGGWLTSSPLSDVQERRDIFYALWEGAASILAEDRPNGGELGAKPAALLLAEAEDVTLPMRPLMKLLARGMGKKEANKLARNRAEDLTL